MPRIHVIYYDHIHNILLSWLVSTYQKWRILLDPYDIHFTVSSVFRTGTEKNPEIISIYIYIFWIILWIINTLDANFSCWYLLDKRCNKNCASNGWEYLLNEWNYLLWPILLDFLWYPFVKKKKVLKKCRWYFDFVFTKVEEFSFSQGPNG